MRVSETEGTMTEMKPAATAPAFYGDWSARTWPKRLKTSAVWAHQESARRRFRDACPKQRDDSFVSQIGLDVETANLTEYPARIVKARLIRRREEVFHGNLKWSKDENTIASFRAFAILRSQYESLDTTADGWMYYFDREGEKAV